MTAFHFLILGSTMDSKVTRLRRIAPVVLSLSCDVIDGPNVEEVFELLYRGDHLGKK
jgi:hypothetical protein